MSDEIKDLVIIGSGPAGLSAAVYGQRAMLNQLVIEKEMYSGGQITVTDRVDNYLGLYGTNGYDLAMKFREHADALEVPFAEGEVTEITDNNEYKEIVLATGEIIRTKAIFVATGAAHKELSCKGEKELKGAGVSYCATCDGAFFKNKAVAVVGGGDVAVGDAIYLSNICEKVYLIHRREELRAAMVLQKRMEEKENIIFKPYYEVKEICGEGKVDNIVVRQNQTGEEETISVSGVFIAVGMEPKSEIVKDLVDLDKSGYIVAGEDCRTGVPGIYAIGDVRTKSLRQVITAVSDGAVAIASLESDRLNV